MKRRHFAALLCAAPASVSFALTPVTPGMQPTEGKEFARVSPPITAAAVGKIEVLEFFSYGCPHCSALEPALEAWVKKLPADVAFQRVPVPFLPNAENYARTYYTLETMGQVNALQRKVFDAVHVQRLPFDKPEDIAALMGKNGLDAAKFLQTFNSFSVANSVNRGKKLATSYDLQGVPALAVQGRYITSPSQAGNNDKALAVADHLIQLARKK
jgi:protein dithiol oxidoreductase (disulfide-forming)